MADPLPFLLVDAFTDRPFAGNPAGVVPLPGDWPSDDWMQLVAREVNQAETAFVRHQPDGWGLRWFTPVAEVDLCGHATLAAAHALWSTGRSSETVLRFHTRSGLLTATSGGDQIELDFPLTPVVPADPPGGLLESLGLAEAGFVGKSDFDYLIELPDAAAVRAAAPDFRRLAGIDTRGVIVTAAADDRRSDFVSRFFAPRFGVDEDPVTGSAHCALADYWGRKLGRTEMVGYQASARGGAVRVAVRGNRVTLAGGARTTIEGVLRG